MHYIGENFLVNVLDCVFVCIKNVFLSQLGYVFVPMIIFAFVGLTIRRFCYEK